MEDQIKELKEFKEKMSIFMNMDFIKMTNQAESLDEFLRMKIETN